MAAYTWELGVDWNAVMTKTTIANVTTTTAYLRNGFVNTTTRPYSLACLDLMSNDTIQFVIFDVTSSSAAQPTATYTLIISSVTALSSVQNANLAIPAIYFSLKPDIAQPNKPTAQSTLYGPLVQNSWSGGLTAQTISTTPWVPGPATVTLTPTSSPPPPSLFGRFLLTLTVTGTYTTGSTTTTVLFIDDPEMVVGGGY